MSKHIQVEVLRERSDNVVKKIGKIAMKLEQHILEQEELMRTMAGIAVSLDTQAQDLEQELEQRSNDPAAD